MSVSNYRKCAKCRRTRSQDMSVTFHRFPNPGKNNIRKAHAWAKYCWPDKDCWSMEFLCSLFKSNKVLCGRHFHSDQFYDNLRQKMIKNAVPASGELLLNKKVVDPLHINKQNLDCTKSATSEKNLSLKNDDVNQDSTVESLDFVYDLEWVLMDEDAVADSNNEKCVQLDEEAAADGNNEECVQLDEEAAAGGNNEDNVQDVYSWQTKNLMSCDDDELETEEGTYCTPETTDDLSKYESISPPAACRLSQQIVPDTGAENRTHVGFSCNLCSGDISGFRYTCVQCADFDICATCESRGVHLAHYMLRVPGPRSYNEVQSVLTTIRRLLLNDSVIQIEGSALDDLTTEIKEEDEDPIYIEDVPNVEMSEESAEKSSTEANEDDIESYCEVSGDDETRCDEQLSEAGSNTQYLLSVRKRKSTERKYDDDDNSKAKSTTDVEISVRIKKLSKQTCDATQGKRRIQNPSSPRNNEVKKPVLERERWTNQNEGSTKKLLLPDRGRYVSILRKHTVLRDTHHRLSGANVKSVLQKS